MDMIVNQQNLRLGLTPRHANPKQPILYFNNFYKFEMLFIV
jgi:hypothetical protein